MNVYSQVKNNKVKSYLIIALFIGLVSLLFYLVGLYFQDPLFYLIFGIGFSAISGFTSYFFSDKIVLKMSGAHPATKEEYFNYYTVTENLCIAAGIPMPKLYVIQDDAPNAFATGRNPDHAVVAATTGLLNTLDRSEIEGVIAHELSHVKNYDILVMTIVTVLVGTIAYTIDFMTRIMWLGGGNRDKDSKLGAIGILIFIAMIILMPLVSTLIKFAVSRKREYLADASGALLTRNPEGLASALEKISSYNKPMKHASHATAHMFISNPLKEERGSRSFMQNLFSTHPPAEERIKILRGMKE